MENDPLEIEGPVVPLSERQSSGWDIRNAPRNYTWLMIFQFGSAAFSFAAVWLINKKIGSEGWGGIFAVIAASQAAQIFVNWTNTALVRYGVDEFVETASIARTFWTRFIILASNLILVLGLAFLWFPPLAKFLQLDAAAFWLVLTHFFVTALWTHMQMGLQAAKMLRSQGLLQMVERLLIFTGVAIVIAAGRLDLVTAILCYILGPAAMTAAGLWQLRGVILTPFSFDARTRNKIILYSLPLFPFMLVGYFSGGYFDALFVTTLMSKADLGIYSIATQINGIVLQLPTLANTMLLPLFVTLQREDQHERTVSYVRNIVPSLTLAWGLACTLFAFVCVFAVPFIFGSEYRPMTAPLWILLTAAVIGMPVAIGYSALSNAAAMTYVAMVAAILSSAANVVGNFTLIPRYGLIGCAAATMVAFFVSMASFAILMNRGAKTPVSWNFIAFAPCIVGAISFIVSEDAFLGLAVCAAASVLVAIAFRTSIWRTWNFIAAMGTRQS